MHRLSCFLALGFLLFLGACGESPDQLRAQRYPNGAPPAAVEATPLPAAGNMTPADMAPVPLAPVATTTTTSSVASSTAMPATSAGAPATAVIRTTTTSTTANALAPTVLVPAPRVEIAKLKFGLTQPDYAPILNAAVAQALRQNPKAVFDVVVVTPAGGSDTQADTEAERARFNGNAVMHAIMNYNVPVERINMSAATDGAAGGTEVRVYTH